MKYLVTMEMGKQTIPAEPDKLEQHVKRVIQQHEAEAELERDGRILAGGSATGQTTDVFIADVNSHRELNDLIRNLPLPHMMVVNVVPLTDFADAAAVERNNLARFGDFAG